MTDKTGRINGRALGAGPDSGAAPVTGQLPLSPGCFCLLAELARSCARRRPGQPEGQADDEIVGGNQRRSERRKDISAAAGRPQDGGARPVGAGTYNPAGQQQ